MSHSFLTPTSLRLALAALVGTAGLLAPLASASGDPAPVRSGWWWAAQAAPSAPVPVPYGTDEGEVFVGRHAGAQDKAAAVWVDVAHLDAPPRVLVVALDELPTTADPLHSGDLLACPIHTGAWESAQGGAWAARPRGGCVEPYVSVGSREDQGRWTFDITAMAAAWHAGTIANDGFELVPAQHLSAPSFEIGLQAPATDDIYVLGGTPSSPATTPTTQVTVPVSPSVPAAPVAAPVDPEPAPLPYQRPEQAAPAAPPAAVVVPAAPAAPSPAATAEAALRLATSRSSQSEDTRHALEALALVACVGAALGWSRYRALVGRAR